jgi:UDP-N-acetylmuramyl pentapeptide phosphotransferase/UDP-N-acetylglucosamine-1-phosphate transferase
VLVDEVRLLISVVVPFVAALALVPVVVRFAIGRDLLDVPNARSSHETPTPRLGGITVILGVWTVWPYLEGGIHFLVAATVAGAVGLLDDILDLPSWAKALGQAVVAFCLLFLSPPALFYAAGPLWPLALLCCVVWVMAVVNAYNFMDGIDGIAGGTAILNTLFLVPMLGGAVGLTVGLVAMAAATTGFLAWNLSPARIFLGDSGSHFLGFFLGAAALYTDPVRGSPVLAFVVAAVVFTPFLFDTAFTLVRRAMERKHIFRAHREHIYQRLTPNPTKHRQVTNVYLGLAALSGLAASFVAMGTPKGLLAGTALVVACCLFMAFLPEISKRMGYDG